MIQRIQTVYWLLAVAAIILWFLLPYAAIEAPEGNITLTALGLSSDGAVHWLFTGWGTLILGGFAGLLLLVAIFSYRRAVWQIRASVFALLLLIGLLLLEGFYIYWTTIKSEGLWRMKIAFWLPLLAALLAYAGFRGVRRDQAFLRRMDRLR